MIIPLSKGIDRMWTSRLKCVAGLARFVEAQETAEPDPAPGAGAWVRASRRVAWAGIALAVVAVLADVAAGDLVRDSSLRNAVPVAGVVGALLALIGLLRREPGRRVVGAVALNALGYVTLLTLLALTFLVFMLASPPCAEC